MKVKPGNRRDSLVVSRRENHGQVIEERGDRLSSLWSIVRFRSFKAAILIVMIPVLISCSRSESSSTVDSSQGAPPAEEDIVLKVTVTNRIGGENGPNAGFLVEFREQPNSDVMVDIVSSDTTEGIPAIGSLMFTADNWDQAQSVAIESQDDSILDNAVAYDITFSPATGKSQTFEIYNLDDEYVLSDPDNGVNMPSYVVGTASGRNIVTDENTGLIWELDVGKSASTLERQDIDSKGWDWNMAKQYCEEFGEGWRLPTREELVSIIDYSAYKPAVNAVLRGTGLHGYTGSHNYWSSTPSSYWTDCNGGTCRWAVDFYVGGVDVGGVNEKYGVRCVKKNNQVAPPSLFIDLKDQTVLDSRTGLVWQKQDDNKKRTWSEAKTYCQSLPLGEKSDWRLPSIYELGSIIDVGTSSAPAINTEAFPNTKWKYWSSTSCADNSEQLCKDTEAWHLYFNYGRVGYQARSSQDYVRCVRGGE